MMPIECLKTALTNALATDRALKEAHRLAGPIEQMILLACLEELRGVVARVSEMKRAMEESQQMTERPMAFLDDGDPELVRAWAEFDDPVMEHEGEVLQYMGSESIDGRWQHCFRHRNNPSTGGRSRFVVHAPVGWEPGATVITPKF